jgi:hypothetical protein
MRGSGRRSGEQREPSRRNASGEMRRSQGQLYEMIASQPGKYIGQVVGFTGRVAQSLRDGPKVGLRVEVSRGAYQSWTDAVYVEFVSDGQGAGFAEGSMVQFRGPFKGIKTYEKQLGGIVPLPTIAACELWAPGYSGFQRSSSTECVVQAAAEKLQAALDREQDAHAAAVEPASLADAPINIAGATGAAPSNSDKRPASDRDQLHQSGAGHRDPVPRRHPPRPQCARDQRVITSDRRRLTGPSPRCSGTSCIRRCPAECHSFCTECHQPCLALPRVARSLPQLL